MKPNTPPFNSEFNPVPVEPHHSVPFYVELWGVSIDTVRRWLEETSTRLKLNQPWHRRRMRSIADRPVSQSEKSLAFAKRALGRAATIRVMAAPQSRFTVGSPNRIRAIMPN